MMLSLKLFSIPHSCPHIRDHCDVITPLIETQVYRLSQSHYQEFYDNVVRLMYLSMYDIRVVRFIRYNEQQVLYSTPRFIRSRRPIPLLAPSLVLFPPCSA
jgi:hypothetical protein